MRIKVLSNRIIAIVVSLVMSFFLWLALSGQDTSTTAMSVPLELSNLPGNLAVKTEIPSSISVQLLANTAQLRFLSDRKLHVWINADSAREGYNAFPIDAELLNLPRGVQIRRIDPQVIEFEAVKTANKAVPLTPVLTGEVDPAFRVKTVIIEPAEVTVNGPHEIMDKLEEVPTSPISLDGLRSNTTLTITPAMATLDPSLVVTPREIRATVMVEERRVEKTFADVPMEVVVKDPALAERLTLNPDTADISVSWPVSRTREVIPTDLKARVFVDEEKLKQDGQVVAPVVAAAPGGVTITAIDPAQVTIKVKPGTVLETPPVVDGAATE